jgi:hypothetical protein
MSTSQPPASADLNEILDALRALRRGDLSMRVKSTPADPVAAELARTLNTTMGELARWTESVIRLAWQIADGKLGGQIPPVPWTREASDLPRTAPTGGAWKEATDRLNAMSQKVADMNRGLGCCLTAAQAGVYTLRVNAEVGCEMEELKVTVNQLLDRLEREHPQAVAV